VVLRLVRCAVGFFWRRSDDVLARGEDDEGQVEGLFFPFLWRLDFGAGPDLEREPFPLWIIRHRRLIDLPRKIMLSPSTQ
jgi:hypothetical protein